MRISDVLDREVSCVDAGQSVLDAARKMRSASVDALPVVDQGRLTGLITERDIVFRAVAEGRAPAELAVREVMTRSLQSCAPDDEVSDVLLQMEEHALLHLAVVDPAGAVLGVVSYDALSSLAAEGDLDDDGEDVELFRYVPSYLRPRH